MADQVEENPVNDDKLQQKEKPEEEKAKKDDTNEKLKTEIQETEKESVKGQERTENEESVEAQDKTENEESVKGQERTENEESVKAQDKTKNEELVKVQERTENEESVNTQERTENVEEGQKKPQEDQTPDKNTTVYEPEKAKEDDGKKDETKKEETAKTVDLKLVQSHYRTHTKTTLPHILTEYGMEDKEQAARKRERKEKKRKKKAMDENEETDDDDRQRRKAREEKFRQAFGDNRESDTYYIEYIDFLEKKVAEQRLKAEKQKEEDKRLALIKHEEEPEGEMEKPKPSEPVEQKQRHRLQKRLQRIELKHDDSFMKDLPRTDISRIIALQDKMKKEGKLKSQGDVDKFWSDIKKPDVFYSHFRSKPIDPIPPQPERQLSETNTNENSADNKDPAMAPRSLSHISEASRGEKEPWAITQKFQSSHGLKTPTGRRNSAQIAKDAALDLERRCPKLEMPPLSCFSLQLGEKPPDPEEIQRKIELKLREKNRKKTQRKINRMYQMAMTNTAAANRIMAQHKDLTTMFEGAALRDVLSVFDEPYMTGHRPEPMSPSMMLDHYPAGVRELLEAAPLSLPSTRQSSASTRQSSAGSRKLSPISDTTSKSSSKSRRQKAQLAIEFPAPVPLSFTELEREKTIEAKCLSSYWTNYMHAGKSVYAPT